MEIMYFLYKFQQKEDELWCPSCKKTHWKPKYTEKPDHCNKCETKLHENPPKHYQRKRLIKNITLSITGIIILAIALFGPATAVYLGTMDIINGISIYSILLLIYIVVDLFFRVGPGIAK